MTDVVPLVNEDGSFKNQKTTEFIDSRVLVNQSDALVDIDVASVYKHLPQYTNLFVDNMFVADKSIGEKGSTILVNQPPMVKDGITYRCWATKEPLTKHDGYNKEKKHIIVVKGSRRTAAISVYRGGIEPKVTPDYGVPLNLVTNDLKKDSTLYTTVFDKNTIAYGVILDIWIPADKTPTQFAKETGAFFGYVDTSVLSSLKPFPVATNYVKAINPKYLRSSRIIDAFLTKAVDTQVFDFRDVSDNSQTITNRSSTYPNNSKEIDTSFNTVFFRMGNTEVKFPKVFTKYFDEFYTQSGVKTNVIVDRNANLLRLEDSGAPIVIGSPSSDPSKPSFGQLVFTDKLYLFWHNSSPASQVVSSGGGGSVGESDASIVGTDLYIDPKTSLVNVPELSGKLSVKVTDIQTTEGVVNPNGWQTTLLFEKVNSGSEIIWPGGSIVYGQPPIGSAFTVTLLRSKGKWVIVYPAPK